MGMRFRKSKNIGGFRINLSKSGIGYSVGCKGVRFTKKANGGTRQTLSIPGTGISYVTENGKHTTSTSGEIVSKKRWGLGKIIFLPFWLPFALTWIVIKVSWTGIKTAMDLIWRRISDVK